MLFSFFLFSLLAFVCSAPTSDATDPLAGVVSHINVNLTASIETDVFTLLDSLITNLANLSFTVSNPLIIEITLNCVAISAGVSGIKFISFTHTFEDPVIVPILGMADSSLIENVVLTQGGLTTLNIIPEGFLDLLNMDLFLREVTIGGILGFPVNDTGLTKSDVPTMCIDWIICFPYHQLKFSSTAELIL
ncbi:hypothetical protein F5146DRAFT_1006422 [Armillaria mellea]|nr:hypothetical protein F5146DRAFT_1006422 [Armillaria mellea]